MIYDVAIIGTGPAGLSAAMNVKILGKSYVWFGSQNLSDKVSKAELISNYPGVGKITGKDLNEAFKRHKDELGLEIIEQMVNQIMPMGKTYAIMAGSEYFEAKSIILTTGIATIGTLPNETSLVGKGISYCATCDGEIYKDRTIAIICNAKRFEHEVKYLADLAKIVYYDPIYKDVTITHDNIERLNSRIVKIEEENSRVKGITLRSGESYQVDGIFCLRDGISLGTLLPQLELESNHIKVNRQMETSLKGIFAAGDCTGRPYQYTKAVGEGNIAAHSAVEYLSSLD